MTSTNDNDLSTPLLGNLSLHEGDADYDLLGNLVSQHEDYMYYADYEYDDEEEEKGLMSCSLKIVYDDEEESEEEEEDSKSSGEKESSGLFDELAVSAALPFLLFLEFGIAFSSASEVDASTTTTTTTTTTGLSWSVVNFSIVLFGITAILYRQAVKSSNKLNAKCSALALLPEIITNIVLSLVLFDKIFAAFCLLLGSMHLMVVLVLGNSIRFKFVTKTSSSTDKDEDEDELDVSFSKGGSVRTTAQIV
jgi:hypothetical protein